MDAARAGSLVLLIVLASAAPAASDLMQREPWQACEYCHGAQGRIDSPDVPAIAGQSAAYIAKQLADFRSGRRASPRGEMRSATLLLDETDDHVVAEYFASLPGPGDRAGGNPAGDAVARTYWSGGNGQAACAGCHPMAGDSRAAGSPVLFGLNRAYLVRQLRAFRDGRRSNDPDGVMRAQAATLSDPQIHALAAYLASQ